MWLKLCNWTISLILFLIVAYNYFFAMCIRCYEYDSIVVDNLHRIPLWYPYDLQESFSNGVRIGDWNHFSDKGTVKSLDCDEGPAKPIEVNSITYAQIGTNVLVGIGREGIPRLTDRTPSESHARYFLFATNMTAVQFFNNKADCERMCKRYGLNGTQLIGTEHIFKNISAYVRRPNSLDVLKYVFRGGLDMDDVKLLAGLFVVWFLLTWQIHRKLKSRSER